MHTKHAKRGYLQTREAVLADIGELAGPVTHEINNLLNTLTLHLAIWQQSSPQALAPDLQVIRQKITHVVKVLNRFQQRRLPMGLEPVLVDLNAALRRVLKDVRPAAPAVTIVLKLDRVPLLVRGHEADIRRLCRYLLANAARSVPAAGPPVIVRTTHTDDEILLEVEDAGPNIPAESVMDLFEPGNEQREGMCCLELAACRSIAHRLRGNVQASARPTGGLIVSVRVPFENKTMMHAEMQKPHPQ